MHMTIISYHRGALYADRRVIVDVGNGSQLKVDRCKIVRDPSNRFAYAITGDVGSDLTNSINLAKITTSLLNYYDETKSVGFSAFIIEPKLITSAGQMILITKDNLWISDHFKTVVPKLVTPEYTYAIGSGADIFQMGICLGMKPKDIFSDLENHVTTCSNEYDCVTQKSLNGFKIVK